NDPAATGLGNLDESVLVQVESQMGLDAEHAGLNIEPVIVEAGALDDLDRDEGGPAQEEEDGDGRERAGTAFYGHSRYSVVYVNPRTTKRAARSSGTFVGVVSALLIRMIGEPRNAL